MPPRSTRGTFPGFLVVITYKIAWTLRAKTENAYDPMLVLSSLLEGA
jgi:hypothetical protein